MSNDKKPETGQERVSRQLAELAEKEKPKIIDTDKIQDDRRRQGRTGDYR